MKDCQHNPAYPALVMVIFLHLVGRREEGVLRKEQWGWKDGKLGGRGNERRGEEVDKRK